MTEPALQLNYAEPGTDSTEPSLRAVKAAKWLGAIPLTLGCLIFVIWLIGRWDGLAFLGFLNLLLGVILTTIGGLVLLVYFLRLRGGIRKRTFRFWKTAWLAVLLLAVNYLAAFLILRAVDYVDTTYPLPDRGHFGPGD